MRRRLLAALVAVLLSLTGAFLLVRYVSAADDRAQAAEALVPVLVVANQVPAGAAASTLAAAVTVVQMPTRLAVDGHLADAADLAGLGSQVTVTDLLPGDQIVPGRFVDPATLVDPDAVVVPAGLEEVTVTLDSERSVGTVLQVGDLVGVLVSVTGTDPATGGTVAVTTAALDRVLVTRVAGGSSSASTDGDLVTTSADSDGLTVTLAVRADQAPVLVAGQEIGGVWLALQVRAGTADNYSTGTTTVGSTTSTSDDSTSTGDDQ